MQKDILVEGVNWNVEGVNKLHQTKDDFIKDHSNDEGTYKNFTKEKKKAILELVYKSIQENTPQKAEVKN